MTYVTQKVTHSSEVAKRGFDHDLSDYRELHVTTTCGMFVSIHVHICVHFYVYVGKQFTCSYPLALHLEVFSSPSTDVNNPWDELECLIQG